jgi:aspartyl-tRNA(Asn)/glutamyl-tRNA(Gln) amidotransferase subunit C
MAITRETLDKIAHLARLEFAEKDADKILKDMNGILAFVDKLDEVDTEGIEPLTSMSHEINAFREDEVKTHLPHEEALVNAPKKDKHFFRVPKVLE